MRRRLNLPPFLRPFVLPHDPVGPDRVGDLDLYLPGSTPAPAVLMVHGGPLRGDLPARPRAWTAYRGYGSLLAHAGLVGAMFEQVDLIGVPAAHHGFETVDDTDVAREGVRRSIAWWAQALG